MSHSIQKYFNHETRLPSYFHIHYCISKLRAHNMHMNGVQLWITFTPYIGSACTIDVLKKVDNNLSAVIIFISLHVCLFKKKLNIQYWNVLKYKLYLFIFVNVSAAHKLCVFLDSRCHYHITNSFFWFFLTCSGVEFCFIFPWSTIDKLVYTQQMCICKL